MDNGVIYEIAASNPNMSDIDRLVNLYHCLSQVLVFDVPGDIVELGCNEGKTSIFLKMIMNFHSTGKELYAFDSFEGLPAPGKHDDYLKQGDCFTTKEQFRRNFELWNLELPIIHEGWFNETLHDSLPEKIAFSYLDGDFYDSIFISLEEVYPRLSKNAIVCIDDYCDLDRNERAWPGLPGVKKACDDFFKNKPENVHVLVGTGDLTMGFIRKE